MDQSQFHDQDFDDNSSIAYSTVTDMSSVSRRRRPKQKQYRKKRLPTRIDTDTVSSLLSNFIKRLNTVFNVNSGTGAKYVCL